MGPTTSIPTVAGTMKRPASVTEAPKPKPVDCGSSTNCGTRMNDANMPKPITSAARFVVHTGRSRIIRMSTSGASRSRLDPDPDREDDRREREEAERPRPRATPTSAPG